MSLPRRHIWQLGMHFDPARGGVDRYFNTLLDGFEAGRMHSTAAAFGSNPPDGEFVERVSLGGANCSSGARARAVRKFGVYLVAQSAPAVIGTHFALYAFFLRAALRRSRIPHIAHFHGPWAEESAAEGQNRLVVGAKRWVERRVLLRADHFITLSEAFRNLLAQSFGVPMQHISVVAPSVSTEQFQAPGDRDFCRDSLGWPRDRRIILCVRRLTARMGLQELLEGFASIAANAPDTDLYLAGRGALEGQLRDQAGKLGLGNRVVFLGFLAEDRLPCAYSAADFSIMPSRLLEGFGLSAIESLACGTPVLVTSVGGLPEAVAGLGDQLLIDCPSPDSIARALLRVIAEPGLLPSRAACREYVLRRFSREQMVRAIVDVYEGTAAGWR